MLTTAAVLIAVSVGGYRLEIYALNLGIPRLHGRTSRGHSSTSAAPPRSVPIEGGGTKYSSSLSGIACTDEAIAAYRGHGALPNRVRGKRSDKQCELVSQPDPTAAAKTLSSTGSGSLKATLRKRRPRRAEA